MAHSKRELPTGRAHTKVAGDDEMLRTGYDDGTPLEGGKIADSQRVDLFAAAHRVAEADPDDSQPQQQQQRKEQRRADDGGTTTTNDENVIAESEPVDLPASARGVAEANNRAAATAADQQPDRLQGVGERATAGGRRLGVGRPGF